MTNLSLKQVGVERRIRSVATLLTTTGIGLELSCPLSGEGPAGQDGKQRRAWDRELDGKGWACCGARAHHHL